MMGSVQDSNGKIYFHCCESLALSMYNVQCYGCVGGHHLSCSLPPPPSPSMKSQVLHACCMFYDDKIPICAVYSTKLVQKQYNKSFSMVYFSYFSDGTSKHRIMMFLCNKICPFLVLIALSGLILAINEVMRHIRHSSMVFRKYYKDGPHYSVSSNFFHHDTQKITDEEHQSEYVDHLWKFSPIVDIASSYHIFHDVIPRRAYYGSRYVAGSNQDVVVVLAEVNATVLEEKLILSCLWNNQHSTSVKIVQDPIMRWVQVNKRGYTHFFAMIYCFGLRVKAVGTEDVLVKIVYKTQKDGGYRSVDTENHLHFLNNASHTKRSNSIVVCATMYGHPVRFEEWLRYQKTIGVDKVHLSVQISFATGIDLYPFLTESIANGFVEVEIWKQYLKDDEIFYYSQSLIYQDCVMRYQSSFEYAAMVDYDDFFVPVVSNKKDIHYYVNHFFDKRIGSIKLPWIELPCAVRNYSFLVDGNVTQTFSGHDFRIKRTEHKSIHRLSAVEIVSIHQAYRIIPGYAKVQVKGVDLAYFTHIRPRKRFCNVQG